ELRTTRTRRGLVLAAEATALACLLVLLPTATARLPWPLTALAILATAVSLARYGRPAGGPPVPPARAPPPLPPPLPHPSLPAHVGLPPHAPPNLGAPTKPAQQISFGPPMPRDGGASRALVAPPYGKGLTDAVRAKDAIASGLDAAPSQVFIPRDPPSHRRHLL